GILAPTWLVVGVLVAWHLVRRYPTRIPAGLLRRMAVETLILAVPLFAILAISTVVLHGALALALPATAAPAAHAGWLEVAMTSIGAGIYEELLFRLLMVGGTLWLAGRVMGRRSEGLTVAVVLVSAAIFAGAHTMDDPSRFAWDSFLYRTAAGTYLGYVFARRGFGIVAGVHMVFDLVVKLGLAAR
ncbi:MAG: CPBP family intramembrane metalloprotease, partial [Planctomycetes bacterium]|nr:CPBP family intramembrane metalloprotease [Planctomycetota bacterium]